MAGKDLFFAVFVSGFSSMIAQVVLLREFVSFAGGNELSYGVVLASWLLIAGAGSLLGGRIGSVRLLAFSQAAAPFFLLAQLFFLRSAGYFFLAPGGVVSVRTLFLCSFLFLLPSMLFGFQFAAAARRCRRIAGLYRYESAGSASGGLLFGFFLVFFLDSFQSVFLLFILNLASFLLLSKNRTAFFLLMLFSVLLFSLGPGSVASALHFSGQNLLFEGNSRYGWLAVAERGGQLDFYGNGALLFTSGDAASNEEVAHFPMAQHPSPKRVLLIGGGASGVLREILRYNVSSVDYLEPDPALVGLGRRFLPDSGIMDPRVHAYGVDGRLFLKARRQYDVIIVNVPDPASAGLNRFYTQEFFSDARRSLADGGVFSVGVAASENYMNEQAVLVNSVVYKTLRSAFRNVLVMPGDRNYFVASDSGLTYDFLGRLDPGLKYVNGYYLKSRLSGERVGYVMSALRDDVPLNTDLRPVSYYLYLLFVASMSGSAGVLFWIGIAIVLFLLLVVLFAVRVPAAVSVLAAGFFGMASMVLLLFSVQVLYGYAYHLVGLLAALFMAGVFFGAGFAGGKRGSKMLVRASLWMVAYPLMLVASLFIFRYFLPAGFRAWVFFGLLAFLPGFIVGAVFPLACSVRRGSAALFYALDLAGAFAGALLVSVFLVPLLGIIHTAFLLVLAGILSLVTIKYL